MPYIKQEHRETVDPYIQALSEHIGDTGDLNYVITSLAVRYLLSKGLSYDHINSVAGVLQKVAAEFDIRVTRLYEDVKIFQNGDIAEYREVAKRIREMQHTVPIQIAPDEDQVHG
jgi:hypothetical protein